MNGFPPGFNEACDDGNPSNLDQCNVTCGLTRCGDGFVQPLNGMGGTEQCDDGNLNNNDACSNSCQFNLCGNGVIDFGEFCDGSNLNGKNCSTVAGSTFCSGTLSCNPPGSLNPCNFNISLCVGCTNCPTGGSSPNSYTGCRSTPPAAGNYSIASSYYTCLSGQKCYKCGAGYVWIASDNKCDVGPNWCGPTPSFLSPFNAHCDSVFGFTQGCLDLLQNQACCTACLSGYDYDCTKNIQQY